MPSNGAENDKCTSMWSFPHITSNDLIVGIPSGLSIGNISLPANTTLIWKKKYFESEKKILEEKRIKRKNNRVSEGRDTVVEREVIEITMIIL